MEKSKVDWKQSEDQATVDRFFSLAGFELSEDNVSNCTLAHFDTLKALEL